MKKTLFQLYLDPDQQDYITKESEKTGRSRAAIVRNLIKKEMEKRRKKQ